MLKATKNPPEVLISKKDFDTKENLPGAKLQITDEQGNIKTTFITNEKDKLITGLKPGKYFVQEIEAPSGYELNSNKTAFTVGEDGSSSKVIIYNQKIKIETKVKISKQDITTKEELSGATLTIKDAEGKIIKTLVSDGNVKIITGLKEGNYSLCETDRKSTRRNSSHIHTPRMPSSA